MKIVIILKIILVFSFFLITPLNTHGAPLFAMMLLWFYQFFADVFTMPFGKVFWEGLFVIPILETLIAAANCKLYKERYLFLFCIITLFLFILTSLGISFDVTYINIGLLSFIIPLLLFISSSTLLLYFNFKKPQEKIA